MPLPQGFGRYRANSLGMKNGTIQFEALNRLATDHIWELTRGRLLDGTRFFENHKLLPEFKRADVKLALLLVVAGNPDERQDFFYRMKSTSKTTCTRPVVITFYGQKTRDIILREKITAAELEELNSYGEAYAASFGRKTWQWAMRHVLLLNHATAKA